MPGAFLYQNRITQAAVLTSVFATTGMPLSNIIDDQPRTRARLAGAPSSTGFYGSVVIDLLAQVSIECIALISTTLDSVAAPNCVVSAKLATVSPLDGDAWTSGVVFANTRAPANGNVVLIRSAGAATGRYLFIEIDGHADPNIDIGRIVAGPLWRMRYAHAYGIEEGRVMLDRRDRNALTGAEFAVPSLRNPRSASFTLPLRATTEAIGEHRTMLATVGAAGEVLWIPDVGLSQSELNLRSLWGAHAQPGDMATAARASFPLASRSFRITERI